MTIPSFTLNTGADIPAVGFGTWLIDDDAVAPLVADAIKAGYRHIDTAQAYGNEAGVGRGIKDSGVAREELFITTKVAAEAKDYDSAAASIDESLRKLGLDYVDLMIIHSPQPWAEFREVDNRFFAENLEAWRALEDAQAAGKIRAIGVSNFLVDDLQNILDNGRVKPAVNQILAHLSNMPTELIGFCKDNDVLVEAYSPLGHGANFKNPKIAALAEKYGVSVAQLSIRYLVQKGLVPLPKTTSPERLRANLDIDFEIADDDMAALDEIKDEPDYGEHSFFPVFAAK
ncbi:aldo/keto reductase [Corynebacterium vitaeruminis]|jgi:diketogulonate reductase-like aldo/keto reductase|uniref:Aldo/keto reductase, diketogulonate reductase n=1 Tax=Corynebacterium vitaeruminis DSM 20294 TaxID=1224164 RepID=W5Y623_9CORY|nr:aldo/keto reductase [Corynebacterium vitaeruminis]AHI21928.1 aldo/keto reductase, diketogulonate reductase [Corynebacterium vitaeruminis DSM 20294]